MSALRIAVLLLVLSPLLLFAQEVVFNQDYSIECAAVNGGCSFFNESIWVNNTVPSVNSSVFIIGTNSTPGFRVQLLLENSTALYALIIHNATVELSNNISLTASFIHVGNSSGLLVHSYSSIVSANATYFVLSSEGALGIAASAVFQWYVFFD